MDDCLREALEIVKAQASVRNMNEDEIASMVSRLTEKLKYLAQPGAAEAAPQAAVVDPKKAFREKSVTCLECGKSFKIITKKHLAQHGLDAKSYIEKYGLKRGTKLIAKELQRNRRKKMSEMRLWEKRAKKGTAEAAGSERTARARQQSRPESQARGRKGRGHGRPEEQGVRQ